MNKKIQVTIKGISPLLMHRFPMEPVEAIEKKTAAEQAEFSAYRMPTTRELYVPGMNLQRSLVSAATYSKGKGRASLQKQVAACVLIEEEYLKLGAKDYQIDSRPVVVPATGGRILRHRPKLENWQLTATITFDDRLINEKELRTVFDDAGQRVGLLDFRPERKGPFGRFMVTAWNGDGEPAENTK